MPRHRGLLVAFVGCVLVSGCATVPDHGGIHAVESSSTGNSVPDEQIRSRAHGPSPGAKPEDVVKGFLTASASSDIDHGIARTYLTTSAARSWQPSARAAIYDETANELVSPAQRLGRTELVPLRAPFVATVAGDGGYTVAPPNRQLRVNFHLVQQAGEWRIADPPAGLLLSRENLGHSLNAQFIYFLNRDLSVLVPNTVFLPVTDQGQATALMRSLLRGPTSWLAPAVRTAIPAGTTLAGPVPIDHGTAIVNLSQEVLDSTAAQRAQLTAQIVWTLSGVPAVTRVRVLADGNALDVPSAGSAETRDDWPTYDPAAISAAAQAFYRVDNRILTVSGAHLPGPVGSGPTTLTHVAVSPDLAFVGGLRTSGGRTTVYAGSLATQPRAVYSTTSTLVAPSWDRSGEMWTVQRTPVQQALLIRPGQPTIRVPAPALAGFDVREMRVSRDGSRVAVIASTSRGPILLIGRVAMTNNGGLRLDGFRNPASSLTGVASVSWADGNTVLLLGRNLGGARLPWLVDVDGVKPAPVTTTGLASYDAVAGAPGQPTVAQSGGASPVIYQAGRGFWSPVGRGSEPSYPG